MRSDQLPAFFAGLGRWADRRSGPVETVAYGEHADQVVELRRPATREPHRLALVLHGGFWRAEYTLRTMDAVAVALAEAGWASGNVEYRRLGPGAYRPLLDDVAAARRRLDGYPVVVAIGHSAGGHLALWLAAEGLVDGTVALGGVCDLAAAARAGLGDDAVQELLGGEPLELPDAYATADPAARRPLGVPQTLVHGVHDDRVPVVHARAYAERARAAGDDCRLVEVDAGHFEVVDPRSPVWADALQALSSVVE